MNAPDAATTLRDAFGLDELPAGVELRFDDRDGEPYLAIPERDAEILLLHDWPSDEPMEERRYSLWLADSEESQRELRALDIQPTIEFLTSSDADHAAHLRGCVAELATAISRARMIGLDVTLSLTERGNLDLTVVRPL